MPHATHSTVTINDPANPHAVPLFEGLSDEVPLVDGEYPATLTEPADAEDPETVHADGVATVEDGVVVLFACADGCPPDPRW